MAANPAALIADAMKATNGVGAPWYTSGDQKWKGTAATLNAKPMMRNAKAARSKVSLVRLLFIRKSRMAVS